MKEKINNGERIRRRKIGIAFKKLWKNPEYLKKMEKMKNINRERMKINNPMKNPEARAKMSERMIKDWQNSEYKEKHSGQNHSNYKGDKIESYSAIHRRIRKNKPKPKVCENFGCVNQPYDVANMSNHIYTTNPNDYKWFCRGCHIKYDRKLL